MWVANLGVHGSWLHWAHLLLSALPIGLSALCVMIGLRIRARDSNSKLATTIRALQPSKQPSNGFAHYSNSPSLPNGTIGPLPGTFFSDFIPGDWPNSVHKSSGAD